MHVCLKKKKNSIHVLHPFCTNALKSSVSPQLLFLSTCPWKKPQPQATRFTVFGGKHYWTEHSPKGLSQCPKARVIRVRARRPLEPCLRTAVTATGSKGKRERLLERKRSWWQRHLNVRFNQKNKLLQVLSMPLCGHRREVKPRGQQWHAGGSLAEQGRFWAWISRQLRH